MDFYVLDTGSGLDTTYLGDITVEEIYPVGPGSNAAWSVAQASFVLTSVANASGGATVYTGTITNGATPANAWQGFYFSISGFTNAANNGGPWLCTASTATTITLHPSGVAETHAGSCAFQNPVQAGILGGIVDGYATTNVGTRPPADNQYIFDSTAGDKTDYAHQTLSLVGTIAGVIHVTQARKDDAVTRQIQQMCLSGGTEEDSATISLGSSYQYYADVLETDPHTGAAWTIAGFNAAAFGIKEITWFDQDLALVVRKPTSSRARVDPDVELLVTRPTNSRARVNQNVVLVLTRTKLGQHVNQDLALLLRKNPATQMFQPNVCVCT